MRLRRWLSIILILLQAAGILSFASVSQAEAAANQGVLMSDTFEDGSFARWTISGGTWSVTDDGTASGNKMLYQSNTSQEAYATAGDSGWTDYIYETRIQLVDDGPYPGMLARFKDTNNYYYFRLNPTSINKLELNKKVNGTDSTLASVNFPTQKGRWYTMRMALEGASIRCYLDGNLIFNVTDSSLASGKIGFRTKWGKAGMDDIAVKPIPDPKPAAPALTAGTPTFTTIPLSWAAAEGEARYRLYRSAKPDSGFVLVYDGAGTSYEDQNLTLGTTYYYNVTVEQNGYESPPSPALSVTTASPSDADSVALDKAALTVPEVVTGHLSLPHTGAYLSEISWKSDHEAHLRPDGVISRPPIGEADLLVKLTATIKRGSVTDAKSFIVTIRAQDPFTGYLMEYRKKSSLPGERFYAVSRDGKAWTGLNGGNAVPQSILDKVLGTAGPDPSVFKALSEDKWYKYEFANGSWSLYSTLNPAGGWSKESSNVSMPADAVTGSFKLISEKEWGYLVNELSSLKSPNVLKLTTKAGFAPRLPELVKVDYTNGLYANLEVVWDAVDPKHYAAVSTFTAGGTVKGGTTRVQAEVTVIDDSAYSDTIRNGEYWYDTSGGMIQAHGGSILKVDDTYYWFGEDKGHNSAVLNGVSIYASKDLKTWEYRNTVLKPDSHPELAYSKIERPKVLYNAATKKYVMWGHWETANSYSPSNVVVAVSDTVDGPYTFLYHFRPYGIGSRDFTLFQDDDGTAYLISATNNGADTSFFQLTDDYLYLDHHMYTILENVRREAPALVKKDGIYYMFSSGQSGWYPNQGKYTTTKNIKDPASWSELKLFGDPTSFYTQPAFIMTLNGSKETHTIYVGDRWNPSELRNSQYIWLPLQLENGIADMNYEREWNFDAATGEVQPSKDLLVSQGKPVTASGQASGFGAPAANDGNYSNYFDWNSTSFPAYWRVDLEREYDLSRIDLSWRETNGSEVYYTYKVEASNDDVNYTTLVDQSKNKTTSFLSHKLSGTYRYVKVTILGEFGHSNNADKPVTWYRGLHEVRVYTSDRKLDPPAGLTATPFITTSQTKETSVNLNWSSVTNAQWYALYRSNDRNGTYSEIYTGRAAGYSDLNVTANQTYYYKVKAFHNGGESEDSAVASVRTFVVPDQLETYDNTVEMKWLDEAGNPKIFPTIQVGSTSYYYEYERDSSGFKQMNVQTSQDGEHWTPKKAVLTRDSHPELAACKFESLNFTYHEGTGKIVVWLHYENNKDYSLGRAAVLSGYPGEALTFHGSFRPNGNDSRDMTFFKDDDGTGYIISAGNNNNDLFLYKLSPDYLTVEKQAAKIHEGKHREAPSMIKKDGFYYLFTSEAAGWYPSKGMYSSAVSIEGPYSELRKIGNSTTFSAQSGGVWTIRGTDTTSYVMQANRWLQGWASGATGSKQRWLPIALDNGYASYDYYDQVLLNRKTGVVVPVQDGMLLSQGKPALAQDSADGKPASYANDGDYTTSWTAANNSWPKWWMVDLEDVYDLSRIQISWYLVNGSEGYHRYQIETSKDGVTFTTALDRTDNKDYGFTSDKLSVEARYVRVKMIDAVLWNNPGNNWYTPQLGEVKVFGYPVDRKPPVTTAAVTPALPDGKNGWYVHPVTVSLAVYDNLPGTLKTEYSLDGGGTWLSYTGAMTVQQNGMNPLSYRSTDRAGNVEAAQKVTIKLDTEAPTITVTGVVYDRMSDTGTWLPLITMKDDVSGIDESTAQATLDSKPYKLGEAIPLYTLPLGSHSLAVSVSDNAGNTKSSTVTFQTYASVDGLKALVARFVQNGWIDNAGIANSLQVKLEHNNIKAFIHEVEAQSNKHITKEAAGYLLRDASAIAR
ncbi:family 43 glycosylhydrolase [Paenibacillus sp. OAS669]|uniref:family 43 glycosylhydrolase n=1 Tax=Paenibacillus sp. OAS669 TaxID=2663821 RepID=UPI00178A6D7D|nr:family 43 glycosylhydrolase [Paenibacillus sp. OAS669]MBE1442369.1 hypothetical protein [Paenibacillus sp. OAS669]